MTKFSREIVLVLSTGAAALITVAAWYRRKQRKNKVPDEWVEVGSVGDLWIYPLKSGRAMEVKEFDCTETGPVFLQENKFPLKDRGFLVYNEKDGEYRTGRNSPKIVLITVTATSQHEIRLDAPDMNPLVVNTSIENPQLVRCSLWGGEPQRCIDCGDEAARWISQYYFKTDSGLRLGMCAGWKRSLSLEPWRNLPGVYPNLKNEDLGIFSDLATYMICNQASIEDLNNKLPIDISPLYFRPNITVVGPKAFAEDDWDWLKIGENVVFRNVRPCTRCNFVNVDPDTGVPVSEQAVLKKLQEYRLVTDKKERQIEGNWPAMGIYAGIRQMGRIKLGDKVYVA